MKKLFFMLGVDRKNVVFLFTAAQVVEEGNSSFYYVIHFYKLWYFG